MANISVYYDVYKSAFVYSATGKPLIIEDYPVIRYKEYKTIEWNIGYWDNSTLAFVATDLTVFSITAWQSALDYDFSTGTDPMIVADNSKIDATNAATGKIVVTYDADTTEFLAAVNGQTNGARYCYIDLNGVDGSAHNVFSASPTNYQVIAKMQIAPGADPSGPSASLYYTKVETDGLLGNYISDITDLTAKATALVDADQVAIADSEATNGNKKTLWSNIKSTLKTYFDTLYATLTHASRHTNGSDDIQSASASQKGLMTIDQATLVDNATVNNTANTLVKRGAAGTIQANQLQAAAADLGAANVTVNLSNSNGSYVTNLTADGTTTSSVGFVGESIALGGAAISAYSNIEITKVSTNPLSGYSYMNVTAKPTYSTTAANYIGGLQFILYPIVNTGYTNSGQISSVSIRNFRNANAAASNDGGTLTDLIGFAMSYGHSSELATTPQTTNAYGYKSILYKVTGTITNAYDIYLGSDAAGGTVTNRYGIYQVNTGINYLAGILGLGIAPTAVLHLKAGTASASTAPLKFTSGTLLSSPEAGTIEYLSGVLYFTNAVPTRLRFVLRDDAAGVQGDILYHNGTNWTALGYGTSGHFLKTQGAGANPVWATIGSSITTPDTPVQGDILYYNGSEWKCLIAGTSGQLLKTQGAGANPVWATVAGAGDVVGPATNTDNYIPQWNGADSKILKNGYPVSATAGAATIPVSDGSNKLDTWISDASDTVKGKVELATAAETTTGTDATRAVTPDGLAGSDYGKRTVAIEVFGSTSDVTTGDGKKFIRIPPWANGWNLVEVAACVFTAGTTGTTDIQIRNKTDSQDMLSTKITIDSTETDSSTAATAAVINTSYDDVATADQIVIDVDAVSTTAPKGLLVELTFQRP